MVELREKRPISNAFLDTCESGTLTLDHVRRLLQLEMDAVTAEITSYTLGGFRHRHPVFIALNKMAHSARSRLPGMGATVGLDAGQLSRMPSTPDWFSYPAFLCWSALHFSQAEFAIAIYADIDRYYTGANEISRALRQNDLDVPAEITGYYSEAAPPGLCESVLAFAQQGIDRGDDPVRAFKVGRLMEESVGRYWSAAVLG
ncbi:hypothetical protein D5H75_33350 [Bailinhaonella thermotolerans]|uniref:Thiaminase-2/PQQC domain-containing protein n=1 Tax=Bailinhaonella thermotolerans TaxID=1070861 RepID=A0A3A4A440_9ACTN|nr:hypothetical protein D5H75_33350 [Bailinhaonella thermotolerans]